MELYHIFKGFVSWLYFVIFFAFCSLDMYMYAVPQYFILDQPLTNDNEASVLVFVVFVLLPPRN